MLQRITPTRACACPLAHLAARRTPHLFEFAVDGIKSTSYETSYLICTLLSICFCGVERVLAKSWRFFRNCSNLVLSKRLTLFANIIGIGTFDGLFFVPTYSSRRAFCLADVELLRRSAQRCRMADDADAAAAESPVRALSLVPS